MHPGPGEGGDVTLAVKHAGTRRLTLLLAVFVLLAVFGTVHHVRTWYYERQLLQLGRGIVQEGNRTDPFPMPAEGPEADVAIKVNCSFAYLFFGPKRGWGCYLCPFSCFFSWAILSFIRMLLISPPRRPISA